MYKIIEKQNSSGTCYEMQTYDSQNNLVDSRLVQINSYSTITDDGKNMIMLYDSRMQPIEDAIRFINFGGMAGQSQNYVFLAETALKFLYAYLGIYGIQLETMTKKEATGYIDFLKGISREGLLYNTELVTKRKNETVSSYIKVARKYVEYLGHDNHILLSKSKSFKTIIMPETEGAKTLQRYDIAVKTPKRTDYVL